MSKTLYQKYRPQKFDQIIGQDKTVNVLKKSINFDKVNNTYLFNGPRGTGKTSISKIFARAINCQSHENPLEDSCEVCQYFESTTTYEDIYELDAASNNGVDDIRKIIDNCWFLPVKLTKKIYIIDEVHMLSKGAFNALLKTLEEPPEHVVFILATTEPNKIPITILSRCQRFDLQRINDTLMNEHLGNILEQENIAFEQTSLQKITDLSDGCVRDALSLLQKIIISETMINEESINRSLNISSDNMLEQLVSLILEGDPIKVVQNWEEIYSSGINETNFLIQMQNFLKAKIIKNDDATRSKLITILYKFNDIEQRSLYTTQVKNIIAIALLELTDSLAKPLISSEVDKVEIPRAKVEPSLPVKKAVEVKTTEPVRVKPVAAKGLEVDNQKIIPILNEASKELRIKAMKEFLTIGNQLNASQKFGLAKFFSEGNLRAATATQLVVTIDSDLVAAYNERKVELLELLDTYLELWIIDSKNWAEILILFKNQNARGETEVVDKPKSEMTNSIVNKLENKLQKKIEIME